MYYIVISKERAYYRTDDHGNRIDCKSATQADRYDKAIAERIAARVGGVAVNEMAPCERRGGAAVEMALVAPIFFMLMFGMIGISRMLLLQHQCNHAALAAARDASLDGATVANVRESIIRKGFMVGVKSWEVSITPDPPTNAGYGQDVVVTISCPLGPNTWIPIPHWFVGEKLTATQQARRETCQ